MPVGDGNYLYDAAGAVSTAGDIVLMGAMPQGGLLLRVTAAAATSGDVTIKMSHEDDMGSPATPEVGGTIAVVAASTVYVPFYASRPYLQATTASDFSGTGAVQIAVTNMRVPKPAADD